MELQQKPPELEALTYIEKGGRYQPLLSQQETDVEKIKGNNKEDKEPGTSNSTEPLPLLVWKGKGGNVKPIQSQETPFHPQSLVIPPSPASPSPGELLT